LNSLQPLLARDAQHFSTHLATHGPSKCTKADLSCKSWC